MPKKYYAVREGRRTGVFETWEACKAQVQGYKGAAFKSFPTKAEAVQFVNSTSTDVPVKDSSVVEAATASEGLPYREGTAVAYVDGSFHAGTGEFSCGAVLFYKGEQHSFSQKFQDPELSAMHNVAGEIMGALVVIRYCLEQGIPALEIHHDYEGVGKWAKGEWKTNKKGTQDYAAACREAGRKIKLSFVKVKGHSGDTWNDEADRLAKLALGIPC